METVTLLYILACGLVVGIIIGVIVVNACSCEHEREKVTQNPIYFDSPTRQDFYPIGIRLTYICKKCKEVKVVKNY